MGPLSIFVFNTDVHPWLSVWVGFLLFIGFTICALIISFMLTRDWDIVKWYKNVGFYGGYHLGVEIVKRQDPTMTSELHWYDHIFIFWFAFMIKYFVPCALWFLMMWNLKADFYKIHKEGKGYNNYHTFWQFAGFMYPAIGLSCFFIPICCPPT